MANGWQNQLKDEITAGVIYERKWKWLKSIPNRGFGFDWIPHAGGGLGNVYTYANTGMQIRFGWNLPDDFGTALLRPGGEIHINYINRDDLPSDRRRFGLHFFVAVDGKLVLRNAFLDGNTIRDSHTVDKNQLTPDVLVGLRLKAGRFDLSYAHVYWTKPFKTEKKGHVFGVICLAYSYSCCFFVCGLVSFARFCQRSHAKVAKCPKCDFYNPDNTKFCGNCAASLQAAKKSPVEYTKTVQKPTQIFYPGDVFAGRYQVIEELGQGGMGKVFKVFDKDVEELVALKLLKPEIASDENTIKRFRNELKLARKISHKNICRMYDLNREKETYFITMEYVHGEDLKSLIRKIGQLPNAKATAITKQVGAGLGEAHRLGIIHRDLKSRNIMIDKEGNAKIMDFGIAHSHKTEGITEAGMMVGSPEYMSPEQVEGKETDQRSDIYSLGVILYEMLAGRVPFEGETTISIALKHKKETPPNPREFNDQVPEDLAQLILRCMEKDPRNRYQDAEELHSDLADRERRKVEKKEGLDIEWKNSIAVLPFADLSPQKDQEYFCDGLAEEVINALTKIKDLRVVARTSAFSFKGEKMDVREIGKKLDVETVLEGSVRKAGDRLRITAQLINVADGYHLWSEKYDRDMEDIFAIQDEVTLAIVDKLKVGLLGREEAELVKRHTDDTEAYNLYMKGRHFLKQMTKESIPKSLECFQQAVEKDPNYAMGYVGIATCYNNLGFYNVVPPKMAYPKAKEAAEKALEIDDRLAEAHAALGYEKMLYEWDWKGADEELKRAIELNPSNSTVHTLYAHYLWTMGRFDESFKEGSIARELNPLSRSLGITMGTIYMSARQYDRSLQEFKKVLEIDPNYYLAYLWMAFPYVTKGMSEEAIVAIEKAVSLSGRGYPMLWTFFGYVYAVSGKKDEANKWLDKMLDMSEKAYVAPWMIASVYAGLGQKDEAFKWMDKSYKQRDHWLIYINISPVVDSLRSDPRFNILLKKMGFK